MNTTTSDSTQDAGSSSGRRRELTFGIAGFAAGFLVLPLLIYFVGTLMLGPYAGDKSIGAFFGEFYTHLFQGAPRAWFIALSPYLAISVVRLTFRRTFFGKPTAPDSTPDVESTKEGAAQPPASGARREPFIST